MGRAISAHAVSRYRERVAPVTVQEAERALSSPTIRTARKMGNCKVILPTGHRVVIQDGIVATVLPKRGQ